MNSIDAYEHMKRLLIAVGYNSESINFNWPLWEADFFNLVKEMGWQNEDDFRANRDAIRYAITLLPADQGGNILPHRKRDGDEG